MTSAVGQPIGPLALLLDLRAAQQSLMDAFLKANGVERKKLAKDIEAIGRTLATMIIELAKECSNLAAPIERVS